MNYELCKQLKDAGFPQPKYGEGYGDWKSESDGYWHKHHENDDIAYAPTLSELIEACGEELVSLSITAPERGSMQKRWIAKGLSMEEDWFQEISSTPEESVAKLWLALNK